MSSHQGLASRLSALSILLIIVMGGVVTLPSHSAGPSGGRLGGAGVTALQVGNSTSASSFTFSNSTTSSTLPASSTSSSVSTTTSNSTATSVITSSNSTSTRYTNSTTTFTSTNSTTAFRSTNSTTTHTSTNSTTIASSTTNATLARSVRTKWDPYADFYSFLNYGLFKDGGDCYCFSSTANLYFRHYSLGDQTTPYYPTPASSTAALPGSTGKYCLLGVCLSSSDTLSQTTFPIYIHQTYGWYYDSGNAPAQPNEQTSIQLLVNSIDAGLPVLMALGPQDGHAIVAWGYSQNSNGSMTISVSDPNFGNTPRHAYYSNGQFSYAGRAGNDLCMSGHLCYTWTEFSMISPATLQRGWLGLGDSNSGQWHSIVSDTNGYYDYVFASVPITILEVPSGGTTTSTTGLVPAYTGQASFGTPGDSLTFNSTIPGVVGFEEGGIQVYGIPAGISFTIKDPGPTSSRIMMVIPQNGTSIVGYDLSSESSQPLNLDVTPTGSNLGVTASNGVSLSVSFFSAGLDRYSVFNATSIPVATSQTALFSVPDWGRLNSSSTAPSLQVFSPGSSQPVASYTLTNGQQGLSQSPGVTALLCPVAVIGAIVIVAVVVFTYSRRRHSSA